VSAASAGTEGSRDFVDNMTKERLADCRMSEPHQRQQHRVNVQHKWCQLQFLL